jgi:integrase
VAAALCEAIETGRLQSGDLVPTVTELAAWFGIARSTAQRAVTELAQNGSIARRGARWVVL